MAQHQESNIGSEFISADLGITRRTANYLKDTEEFPPIMWIGRTWRVNRDEYEAWKVLCYKVKRVK
jgi:hypothetical protein